MVHGDAQRVNIRPGVCLGLAELLRRGIALGADVGGVALRLLLILAGDTEVDQLQAAILLKHDIGGLHIPVNDGVGLLRMQIVQHLAQVTKPLDAKGFIDPVPVLDIVLKRNALHIVLDDANGGIILENIHDAGQHRVL